jgi:hypothetical protein
MIATASGRTRVPKLRWRRSDFDRRGGSIISESHALGFVAILDMLTPINIVIRNAILVALIDHPISEGRNADVPSSECANIACGRSRVRHSSRSLANCDASRLHAP